jgi:poly(hydroxyalkanoate) granule associated protein phasin
MATKPKRRAAKTVAQIERVRTRKRGAVPSEASGSESVAEAAQPNLLRAGLKALGNARDEVVQRQSRVFEVILGLEPGQGWSGLVKRDAAIKKAAQEAFGLRKFEAVFDERVAHALERMGMPSTEALRTLTEEVAALKAELRSLKAAQRKR